MFRWTGLILLFLCVVFGGQSAGAQVIEGMDVDGSKTTLNPTGKVTVVLYSNEASAGQTREAGRVLYPFHGKSEFRLRVVVDLRSSLALFAKGYASRRIRDDLDREAEILKPYYRDNKNEKDPRKDLKAFADFEGAVCEPLGWGKRTKTLRAVLFGRSGEVVRRWEDLKDMDGLVEAVDRALTGTKVAETLR